MKRKPKNNPSQPLIDRIHSENRRRGYTLQDLARELGISHIYLASLTNGARQLRGLGLEKQRALAKYLRLSMLEFFLMIGVLRTEDLIPGDPV